MKTECSKCQTAMPPERKHDNPWLNLGVVTGYKCKSCGHWNNLKRRRGYAAWREKQMEGAK